MHVRGTLGSIFRDGMLGLDVVVLADADADALVREAPREEGRLGHAGEGFAGMDGHWARDGGHHVDNLALDELKESEPQAEATFDADRNVAKDKEAAVRVVDILETVEGRDNGAGKGTVGGGDNLAIGVVSVDQVATHEQIWALEVILVFVGGGVGKLDLDDWRGVDGATIALLVAADLCPLGLLADGEDVF